VDGVDIEDVVDVEVDEEVLDDEVELALELR